MKIEFVKYNKLFLSLSWEWLNDPEVKKLTNTPDFSKEDQLNWFNSLNEKKDYKIWGIMVDDIPIGVCGLKNIENIDCEYWGYIGEKKYWGRGIGKELIKFSINEAKKMGLSSIWLNVRDDNIRAIKLYTKYGFIKEKKLDEMVSIYRIILEIIVKL
jgi:RimJ/RimL family protein N-acetyltransferase